VQVYPRVGLKGLQAPHVPSSEWLSQTISSQSVRVWEKMLAILGSTNRRSLSAGRQMETRGGMRELSMVIGYGRKKRAKDAVMTSEILPTIQNEPVAQRLPHHGPRRIGAIYRHSMNHRFQDSDPTECARRACIDVLQRP
jgi:hypothetical protein